MWLWLFIGIHFLHQSFFATLWMFWAKEQLEVGLCQTDTDWGGKQDQLSKSLSDWAGRWEPCATDKETHAEGLGTVFLKVIYADISKVVRATPLCWSNIDLRIRCSSVATAYAAENSAMKETVQEIMMQRCNQLREDQEKICKPSESMSLRDSKGHRVQIFSRQMNVKALLRSRKCSYLKRSSKCTTEILNYRQTTCWQEYSHLM